MQTWGRYRLVRPIGQGGQAKVWEAELHGPSGSVLRVALKQFGARVQRPEHEGRLGGLLRHPNLLDVYEVGDIDGRPFCAMELCTGGSLSGRDPMPPRAVVEVGLQVCAALGYAWSELRLVHLDLKPANLLLSGATVKVADLGIARARGFEGRGVRGTVGYMSPEQARGGSVDTRSDVWALGVVLAELASGARGGHTPTSSMTAEFAADPFLDAPFVAPPSNHAAWLDAILAQCLDPDPRGRFQTMEELADALRGLDLKGPGLAEWIGPLPPDPVQALEPPIGRDAELRELTDRLSWPGIVTLKGPGGIGKTRLARAVAAQHASVVAWLSVDRDSGRSALIEGVASALGVALGAGSESDHLERIGFALAARAGLLLVLDGFDALVTEADVVAAWCTKAPGLRVLLTSQRPIGLLGEQVVELGALAPEAAVQLIAHRAAERGHDVAADPVLAEIARQTGGIPLALELAAGRIGVLSPREVLARLGVAFLRSSRADRHGTLLTTLDWSWDQLPQTDRVRLGQLSVFRGGFDLQAAEAVLQAESGALSAITALMDHSLVQPATRAASPGQGRFELSAMVREHAADRLRRLDGGEELLGAAEIRHGVHFGRSLPGGRAHADRDNVLVACRRAIERADRPTAVATCRVASDLLDMTGPYAEALELARLALALPGLTDAERGALGQIEVWALQQLGRTDEMLERSEVALQAARAAGDATTEGLVRRSQAIVFRQRGRNDEALALLLGTLDSVPDPDVRGRLLITLGGLHTDQGRWDDARACFDQARVLFERLAGRKERLALANLAVVALNQGQPERALSLQQQALPLCREVGDRRGEAQILGDIGLGLANLGRERDAEDAYTQAIEAHRAQGNRRFEGIVLYNLGWLKHQQRQVSQAGDHYAAALEIQRSVGNRRSEGIVLASWGSLLCETGRASAGEPMLRDAIAIHRAVGNARFEGNALGHLAKALVGLGRGEEAREIARQAIDVLRRVGDPQTLVEGLCDAVEVERAVGSTDVAAGLAGEAGGLLAGLAESVRRGFETRLYGRPTAASEPPS